METTPLAIEVYTAILNQTGTSNPVATVLHNTFSQPVTWTRRGVGIYDFESTGLLDNKSAIFVTPGVDSRILWAYPDNDIATIESFDLGLNHTEGLDMVCVEIRKYNNI